MTEKSIYFFFDGEVKEIMKLRDDHVDLCQ